MLRTSLEAQFQLIVFGAALSVHGADTQDEYQPLSIQLSEYWDGVDGRWSTFFLNIGNPAQLVRLLPGTSATAGDSIWAVLPEGCYLANPNMDEKACETSRGGVFTRNHSTTWSTSRLANGGLYGLDTYEEQRLGLSGNAYYGFDTISFMSGQALLNDQIVAGIATSDFWLGSLGLSPLPINFTSLNEPTPSLLGRLRNASMVPSTTWAYTAGAVYKEPPVFGSLTFGGYDAARMEGLGLSLPFWSDQSRDLLVGLQSVTYNTLGSTPLMTTGVYAFIDSVVTHMWLPIEVCEAFEQAFGLVWDDAEELYLLNETTHARLQAQNPAFRFTLAATINDDSTNTTTITLPYSAFDLNVSQPLVNATTPYFPLKRAQNSTQYTLGRVFLQEAYVVADYDRRNFTVGQAAFPSGSTQDLRAILPPGFHVDDTGDTLSAGTIAGIIVGAVVLVLLIAGVAYLCWARRKRNRERTNIAGSKTEQNAFLCNEAKEEQYHEADPTQISEAYGSSSHTKPGELPSSEAFLGVELPGGRGIGQSELPATAPAVYEMPGEGVAAAEMEASLEQTRRSRASHSR